MTKIEYGTLSAVFGSGLIGGVFFGFSTFVMGALQAITPSAGIAAMQSINIVVKNVWFCAFLFGLVPLCMWLGFASYASRDLASRLRLLASLLYLLGCIGVTFAGNVPRNDALALVDAHSPEGAALWASFVPSWTLWNHVRCASSCLASLLFLLSLVLPHTAVEQHGVPAMPNKFAKTQP